jgi:hypothetical protein
MTYDCTIPGEKGREQWYRSAFKNSPPLLYLIVPAGTADYICITMIDTIILTNCTNDAYIFDTNTPAAAAIMFAVYSSTSSTNIGRDKSDKSVPAGTGVCNTYHKYRHNYTN